MIITECEQAAITRLAAQKRAANEERFRNFIIARDAKKSAEAQKQAADSARFSKFWCVCAGCGASARGGSYPFSLLSDNEMKSARKNRIETLCFDCE
ncbi:hypothetical protein Acife_1916 [Acidithiobacillus ferrivorans SS3]|uniref:Uncharacterized protein n=1 Tax=Acidithiobacillus ferrivorans SS3 TaxID=743299 RepID=G0JLJ0_9PROT|nr:hypothetical protein [Acidithiobacillus ferrivorans]AEM48039.1 hypothetical protein Acife_1916 [Acidithiobacillus ferrivorans SS3]